MMDSSASRVGNAGVCEGADKPIACTNEPDAAAPPAIAVSGEASLHSDASGFLAATGLLAAIGLAGCGDDSLSGSQPSTASVKPKANEPAASTLPSPVYRFAKISNGAYFYTGNRGEKDQVLSSFPDFRYEGVAFYQSPPGSGVPVFRFANLGNGGYFYTANPQERDFVIQTRPDLRFEGSTFSVASPDAEGTLAVYRLANLGNGAYLYTTSAAERDAAVAGGAWRAEGISFYTLDVPPSYARAETDAEAARFLLQAQLNASDADIAAVRAKGYASWLSEQFDAPTGIKAWDWLQSRGYGVLDPQRYYNQTYLTDYFAWHQLFTSPDGMRKRLALALSEYFVISVDGIVNFWPSQIVAHYWDILSAGAGGNFRKLLEDVTLSVGMGLYLNTVNNQKEDANGRLPDENYAREIMQLFTIGLYQLNPDGTEQRGAAGDRIETYSQADVSNLARVFTGYVTDREPRQANPFDKLAPLVDTTAFTRLPMKFNASAHSNLAVNFLRTSIPANTAGPAALKMALDTLFNHPNVGPFFGRQMIQRLVTSHPSPAYVARVTAAFNDNGSGVRGDLRAVFSAILLDPEARGPAGLTDPGFGKVREPMIRFAQWGRSFGIQSASGTWRVPDTSDPATRLGQSPMRSPSVFNYFRPGYVPPNTAMASVGATAPEFQIVDETSVSGYVNYLYDIVRYGILVRSPDIVHPVTSGPLVFDITASYASELAICLDSNALVRRLNLILCAGQLSSATQTLVVNALNATPLNATSTDTARLDRIGSAVLLVMASPDYLIQK